MPIFAAVILTLNKHINEKLNLLISISGCSSCSPTEQEKKEIHGIDLANMDPTANPTDDFYTFANGAWLDKTEIPGKAGAWGGFSQLREETNNEMIDILDEAIRSGSYAEGTDQRKASDFFSIGMDSLLAEKAGITPVRNYLRKLMLFHQLTICKKFWLSFMFIA